jgi:hypothetical protein
LKNVADEIKQDSDLKDKKQGDTDLKKKDKTDRDLVSKQVQEHGTNLPETTAVKTLAMEDGRVCEIHGDEHAGFEIRHGNRQLPTRFKKLEEAEMALEMFMHRRRKHDQAQDYVDEA